MRRLLVWVAVLLAVVVSLSPPVAVGAHGSFCGIRWGSLLKEDQSERLANLTDIRAGRHECFDRLVFDLGPPRGGPGPGVRYRVQYYVPFDDPPASGAGAYLSVFLLVSMFEAGTITYDSSRSVDVTGFATFRHVRFLPEIERGHVLELGVRARLPFRVFILTGPGSGSRLVIDVAHRW
jgi:hypothetical protein